MIFIPFFIYKLVSINCCLSLDLNGRYIIDQTNNKRIGYPIKKPGLPKKFSNKTRGVPIGASIKYIKLVPSKIFIP